MALLFVVAVRSMVALALERMRRSMRGTESALVDQNGREYPHVNNVNLMFETVVLKTAFHAFTTDVI